MITSAVADIRKLYAISVPHAPLPEYPLEGRAKHWTGSGLLTVSADVDDGLVNSVTPAAPGILS